MRDGNHSANKPLMNIFFSVGNKHWLIDCPPHQKIINWKYCIYSIPQVWIEWNDGSIINTSGIHKELFASGISSLKHITYEHKDKDTHNSPFSSYFVLWLIFFFQSAFMSFCGKKVHLICIHYQDTSVSGFFPPPDDPYGSNVVTHLERAV